MLEGGLKTVAPGAVGQNRGTLNITREQLLWLRSYWKACYLGELDWAIEIL